MKTRRRIPPRFRAETRFEVTPVPSAPFRGAAETELERLKERLLREALGEAEDPDTWAALRRASHDAAALAWAASFPLLLLPELFREKATAARRYARKQATVINRGEKPVGEAA